MTVSEMRKRLEGLEKEGFGNLPMKVEVHSGPCQIDTIKVQGSGIQSSAERVLVVPINELWYA